MEIKTLGQIKALSETGEGMAVFATLNVIDKDRDVTLPGAFGEQSAAFVPAHDWQSTPIGKVKIFEKEDQAIADFKMNLKTDLGKEWYEALKFDFENPPRKQEYSYGFSIRDGGAEDGVFEGTPVRFLKSLEVHEVSPVLVGAGVATRTLALKKKSGITFDEDGVSFEDQLKTAVEQVASVIERAQAIKELRTKQGRDLSKDRTAQIDELSLRVNDLRQLFEASSDEAKVLAKFNDLQVAFYSLRKRGIEL